MTPFILWALAHEHFLLGGWLFGGAAFTDMLDGAVARKFGGETKFGQYLDPIADKTLLVSMYLGLAAGHAIPVWTVALIFGRDLWIVLMSAIALKFTTYRNLTPSVWGKASTFLQIMTAIALMGAYGYKDAVLLRICDFMIWGLAILAIISGLDYTWRGVRWFIDKRKPAPVSV